MKILVTGGTGMTGAHLLLKLVEKGNAVFALYRNKSNIKNTKKIFNYHKSNADEFFSKINWIEGDITDINSLNDAIKNVDYVYHTAATVSFIPSEKDRMIYNNVKGTANVVNACLRNNVKKLCHISSISALGKSLKGVDVSENTERKGNLNVSDYGISKFRSENEVWRGIAEGLNAVIVNPSIIIGVGNWEHGSPRMIKTVWNGLKYYTKGGSGFVDVEDVANIMIKLTEGEIVGERFLLNSENMPFRTVFDTIADNLNKKRANIFASNFLLHTLKNFDKFRLLILGKEPRITIHTLRSAQKIERYSNKKIKQAIQYDFKPIRDSIKDICEVFLKEVEQKR